MKQQLAMWIYLIVLFGAMYFLLIRPQHQRQRQHRKMINELKLNDNIITSGGIYGTITKIKEDTVIVRVADNVRLELLKSAVSMIRETEDTE